MAELRFGRYSFEISNEDKVLFPKSGITKGELIDYYQQIADIMVPYVKNRAISMVRYPNGIDHEGFFQKDAGSYFPAWIKTFPLKKQDGGITNYVVINNNATLVYLANQACITPHIWLSRIDKINLPDRLIFDLDPSENDFSNVQKAALILKEVFAKFNITTFVMTTGQAGLHVVIPLKRKYDFDWVRNFAQDVGRYVIRLYPELFTLEIRKEKRGRRIFLDTLRNAFGQTGVAPYAVRPKENAPVAAPLHWNEVSDPTWRSNKYTIRTIFKRIAKIGDPWEDIEKHAVLLTSARKELDVWLSTD